MRLAKHVGGFSAGRADNKRRQDPGQQGFTLVEMLVVIAIIGLIMGLIGPRVLNYLSESKVKAAKIQLQSFGSALDLFYLDAGRFPSTAEGLMALVRPWPVRYPVLWIGWPGRRQRSGGRPFRRKHGQREK